MIITKPFKSTIDNYLTIINECSLMAISLLQLLFVTEIKDQDTINYTGWVMISICTINIATNFMISFVINIRRKCNKMTTRSERNKVQNFREDVVIFGAKIATNASRFTTKMSSSKITTGNLFNDNTEEFKKPPAKISSSKYRKQQQVCS